MPRRDGTGPVGYGPMTGRGMGLCNPQAEDVYYRRGLGLGCGRGIGRGFGRGLGRGLGRGFLNGPVLDPAEEMDRKYMERQKDFLQAQLDFLNKRLTEEE